MITIAMSKVIHTPRERVWSALISPMELLRWDVRRVELVEPAPNYPATGTTARWRGLLGTVTVPHLETPVEVIEFQRLRSYVRIGSFHFEEAYTLAEDAPDITRLSLRLSAKNSVALMGGALDRFDVRRLTVERVDESLDLLQRWCEPLDGVLDESSLSEAEAAQMCSSSDTQRSGEVKRSRASGSRSTVS